MEVSIMKTFFLQLLCFWLSVSAYAQVECALTHVSREERMKLPYYGNNDTLYRILENLKTPANVSHQRMSGAGYQVPVKFYVHRRTDGTGQASDIENGAS
jgi:ribosomal protein S7